MLQTAKSWLIKLLTVICIVCCAVALCFGISACTGADGKDGVGVSSFDYSNGTLTITLTDGTTKSVDISSAAEDGEDGDDGVSVTDAYVSEADGNLYIVLSNSTDPIKCGSVLGEDGDDGVGIASVAIDSGVASADGSSTVYTLTITYTDSTVEATKLSFTVVNGKDGEDGEDGATWYSGTTAEMASITAKEGDFYLDTDTYNVSQYVADEQTGDLEWVEIANIKGADGVGENGVGIASVEYTADGELVIVLDDEDSTTYTFTIITKDVVTDYSKEYIIKEQTDCEEVGLLLTIYYTDDTYTSVCGKVFSEIDAMDHYNDLYELISDEDAWAALYDEYEKAELVVYVKPTCTEAGYWSYICENCGKEIYTVENAKDPATGHKMTHTAAVAATCVSDGNIEYYYCSVCGKYFSDAKGANEIKASSLVIKASTNYHSYVTTKTWVDSDDEDATTCDTAYWTLEVCEYCSTITTVRHEADGHTVAEWKIDKDPTTKAEGTIYGYCTTCGKLDATVTLPKLNNKDYTYVAGTKTNCSNTTTDTYTIEVKTVSEEGEEGVQSFTFEVTVGAEDHKSNGVKVDDSVTYDLDTYVGTSTTVTWANYIKVAGNSTNCGYVMDENGNYLNSEGDITTVEDEYVRYTGTGYFTCSVCGELITVTIYVPHTFDSDSEWTTVKDATCTEEGSEYNVCTVCDETIYRTIPATGHTYVYELYVDNDGEPILDDDGYYQVQEVCSVCGVVKTGSLLSVTDFVRKTETKPTCTEEGLDIITITLTDGKTTFVIEVVTAATGHSYNGVSIPDDAVIYVNDTGAYYLDDDNKEVTIYNATDLANGVTAIKFAGNSAVSCGDEAGSVYYTCDGCGQVIVLSGKAPHTKAAVTDGLYTIGEGDDAITYHVTENEKLVGTDDDEDYAYMYYIVEAGCTTGGVTYYLCSECGKIYEGVTTKATGHALVYEVTVNKDGSYTYYSLNADGKTYKEDEKGSYIMLTVSCENCDDYETQYIYGIIDSEVTKEPTCTTVGTMFYTVTYTDENNKEAYIKWTEEIAETEHILNGVEVDDEVIYYLGDGEAYYLEDNTAQYIYDSTKENITEIKLSGNSNAGCSENDETYGTAYFTCEDCGEIIIVSVKTAHTKAAVTGGLAEYDGTTYYMTSDEELADSTEKYTVTDEEGTEHEYSYMYYIVPAGHDTVGYIYYTCSVCGETFKDEIAMTGHTYVQVTEGDIAEVETTYDGVLASVTFYLTCEDGDCEIFAVTIDAKNEGLKVTTKEASCTNEASTTYEIIYYYSEEDNSAETYIHLIYTEGGKEISPAKHVAYKDVNGEDIVYTWMYEETDSKGVTTYTVYNVTICSICGEVITSEKTVCTYAVADGVEAELTNTGSRFTTYYFYATSAGTYVFEIVVEGDDEDAYLTIGSDNYYDGEIAVIECEEGDILDLYVTPTATVSIHKSLEAGVETTIALDEDNNEAIYYFVVEETGYYTVSFEGANVALTILDADETYYYAVGGKGDVKVEYIIDYNNYSEDAPISIPAGTVLKITVIGSADATLTITLDEDYKATTPSTSTADYTINASTSDLSIVVSEGDKITVYVEVGGNYTFTCDGSDGVDVTYTHFDTYYQEWGDEAYADNVYSGSDTLTLKEGDTITLTLYDNASTDSETIVISYAE